MMDLYQIHISFVLQSPFYDFNKFGKAVIIFLLYIYLKCN